MQPLIQTYSGLYFDFKKPHIDQITIEDIAHALANTCRYNGHCTHFYSVAQHAVLVSQIVDEKFAWEALHHDDAEAYTGDVPTPLKQLIPQFKKIEKRVEKVLAKKFKNPKELSHEVKYADLQALLIEKKCIMKVQDYWSCLDGINAPKIDHVIPLPPELAERLYLDRFNELAEKFYK